MRSLILGILVTFGVVGCGDAGPPPPTPESEAPTPELTEEELKMEMEANQTPE